MSWSKGTPLVATVAELRQLTGVTDLANLEGDSELTLTNVLTTASDQLFVYLEDQGVNPTLLQNSADFKHAVAAHAIAMLTKARHLLPPEGQLAPLDPFAWSEPLLKRVRPKLADNSVPQIGMARPRTRNLGRRHF